MGAQQKCQVLSATICHMRSPDSNQCLLDSHACEWATGLTFSLPDTLNQLLVSYLTMSKAQLTNNPVPFVDLEGRPLIKTSMSSYFCTMLSKMDPSFLGSSPSLLGHIFVDQRRSRQRVEGPLVAAVARVMGNSTQASRQNYDLHSDVREAQAAVDAMQTWRQHLLAKQQAVLVEAPAEEGAAEMSASDGTDTA